MNNQDAPLMDADEIVDLVTELARRIRAPGGEPDIRLVGEQNGILDRFQ